MHLKGEYRCHKLLSRTRMGVQINRAATAGFLSFPVLKKIVSHLSTFGFVAQIVQMKFVQNWEWPSCQVQRPTNWVKFITFFSPADHCPVHHRDFSLGKMGKAADVCVWLLCSRPSAAWEKPSYLSITVDFPIVWPCWIFALCCQIPHSFFIQSFIQSQLFVSAPNLDNGFHVQSANLTQG